MLIHRGKVYLGQSDRLDLTTKGEGIEPTVVILPAKEDVTDAELDAWAEQRFQAKVNREKRLAAMTLEDPGSDPRG